MGDVDVGLTEGILKFVLSGERMRGAWMLVRMKPRAGEKRESWLLIKEHDLHEANDPDGLITLHQSSVLTSRTMSEIAAGTTPKRRPRSRVRPPRTQFARPPFHPVQLAKLHAVVPTGGEWLHEVKVDGYRCLAALGGGSVRLFTRNGLDWTTQFGALVPSLETLKCNSALIDGEVTAAGANTNAFSQLQARLKHGGALEFVAFDLLHLNGRDLTALPLKERKTALDRLVGQCDGAIRYSTHIEGHGPDAWAAVCAHGREGLVSKLASAPYHSGRHGSWLKLKCGRRQEFVIGGWSPSSSKGRPFASLLMGSFEEGRLIYRGRVGSGFGEREFDDLVPMLSARARKTPPYADVPSEVRSANWVTPDLVAEVKFTELTEDGHIRHGTFQALRRDKPAKDVSLDHAAEETIATHPVGSRTRKVKGVTITSHDRHVFDTPPVTKLQVAQYYADVADRMLPFTRKRPVSLLRCPDGIAGACFFQKHRGDGMGRSIQTVAISDEDGDQNYITLPTETALVAAAQMGAVEFHIWGAPNAALDRPDRIVFDLDPDDGLPFASVRSAAFDLRDRLNDLGLPSVPMLTGGKGIHVIVPLRRKADWETVKLLARTIAVMLSDAEPERFIATMSKAKRKGLIFIDWLRNERGATAVAPYSLRARPGARVAVPVTWDELKQVVSAGAFDIASVSEMLGATCPLKDITQQAVTLDDKILRRLEKQFTG